MCSGTVHTQALTHSARKVPSGCAYFSKVDHNVAAKLVKEKAKRSSKPFRGKEIDGEDFKHQHQLS